MLCLTDSLRDDDPCVQRLLCMVEEAHTLPELILALWALARVLARHLVESGLAERARRPTSWPHCPQCGACLRSKGFVKRQVISLVGPLRWRHRVGRWPQGCEHPRWLLWMKPWNCTPISGPALNSSPWAVPWRSLCRLPPRPRCWAG